MPSGYYRFPTIHKANVVFVCEDDLWTVPAGGGIARRLTSNLGEATRPVLSPDGTQLAFVGRDEGQPEVYVMPALGGQAKPSGSRTRLTQWLNDGKRWGAARVILRDRFTRAGRLWGRADNAACASSQQRRRAKSPAER